MNWWDSLLTAIQSIAASLKEIAVALDELNTRDSGRV